MKNSERRNKTEADATFAGRIHSSALRPKCPASEQNVSLTANPQTGDKILLSPAGKNDFLSVAKSGAQGATHHGDVITGKYLQNHG
jgi:hypothetical protein